MEFSAFLKWDAATWNLPDNKHENNEYFSAKPSLQSRYHLTTSGVSIFFRPLAASLLPLQHTEQSTVKASLLIKYHIKRSTCIQRGWPLNAG